MAAQETEALAFEEGLRRQLTVVLLQNGFVVEEIKLGGGTRHVQENHSFGFGRVMGNRAQEFGCEQLVEGQGADTESCASEKGAAFQCGIGVHLIGEGFRAG